MALVVQKFGGSSVADTDKIKNVARKALREKERGNQVVMVVSAMGKTTDGLINLAHQISDDPPAREMDMLMSTGEQVTIALLAIALQSMGHKAISFTGPQVGIITDAVHRKAHIKRINVKKIKESLDIGSIVIVAGFQGCTEDNDITTLGRGGSDTTAVALAAALKADVCDIYTDVDGVYTADPRIVTGARKLDRISYEEMLEQASLGAKVLQPRSVELAMVYKVPLQVRSSFEAPDSPNQNKPDGSGPGTIVCEEDKIVEQHVVSGIAYSRDEAKVSIRKVKDQPGVSASVFGPLAEADISVDMIVQNVSTDGSTANITFTVARKDLRKAIEVLNGVKDKIGFLELTHSADVAKVSVVGIGMRSHAGVAAKMFRSLADKGINIQAITTSGCEATMPIGAGMTSPEGKVRLMIFALLNSMKLHPDA